MPFRAVVRNFNPWVPIFASLNKDYFPSLNSVNSLCAYWKFHGFPGACGTQANADPAICIENQCNLPSIRSAIRICWRAERIWGSCGNIKITTRSPYRHRRCYKRGWRMFTTGPEAISAAWRPCQMRLKAMRTIHNSLISMMFMHFSRRANSFNWTVLVKYKAFSAHWIW